MHWSRSSTQKQLLPESGPPEDADVRALASPGQCGMKISVSPPGCLVGSVLLKELGREA